MSITSRKKNGKRKYRNWSRRKSVTITGTFNIQATLSGSYVSSITASQSVTLDKIPRAAQITSAPNFTDEDNPTITYANNAGTIVSKIEACITNADGTTTYATNGAEYTTINIGTINATITNNKAQVCTRLIEAKYPNYKAIIPQSFNFNADFDKNDITNSIKRVMIATEQSDKRIKIEFNNMYANISVNNNTQRKKAQETCQYITTELQQIPTMVVNGNYIQDGLNCIKTNNVSILINDEKKPFVMKENNSNNNSNKTILIMPCVHN